MNDDTFHLNMLLPNPLIQNYRPSEGAIMSHLKSSHPKERNNPNWSGFGGGLSCWIQKRERKVPFTYKGVGGAMELPGRNPEAGDDDHLGTPEYIRQGEPSKQLPARQKEKKMFIIRTSGHLAGSSRSRAGGTPCFISPLNRAMLAIITVMNNSKYSAARRRIKRERKRLSRKSYVGRCFLLFFFATYLRRWWVLKGTTCYLYGTLSLSISTKEEDSNREEESHMMASPHLHFFLSQEEIDTTGLYSHGKLFFLITRRRRRRTSFKIPPRSHQMVVPAGQGPDDDREKWSYCEKQQIFPFPTKVV